MLRKELHLQSYMKLSRSTAVREKREKRGEKKRRERRKKEKRERKRKKGEGKQTACGVGCWWSATRAGEEPSTKKGATERSTVRHKG